MKKKPEKTLDASPLRRRAVARLREKQRSQRLARRSPGEGESERGGSPAIVLAKAVQKTTDDTQRLVQELLIHRIELEMQNEELQNARAEMEAALDRYTDLYDFAPVGYFTLGRDGTISRVNLTGAVLLECERSGLVNRRFALFVSDDTRPAFNAFLAKVFEGRSKETCEVALRKKGNQALFVHIDATVIEAGQECRAVVVDISERKRAEQALQESEERYRVAIECSNDGVVIVRGDSNVFVNQRFVEMLGYDRPEDMVGQSFSMTAHPDDLEKITEYNLRRQRGETVPARYETRCLRKDGKEICVDISATRIMYQGQPASLAYLRDVTNDVKSRQQLRQAQKMEAIGTLAGGIAHDFNNILTAVIGFSELARDEVAKGSSLEGHLQEVLTAGKRARDLVKHILTFSRETEGNAGPVAVNLILKEILKMIRASLPATIEIRQDIRSDSQVLADPTQIHQVLMNLCTNAAHAMEEKGGVLEVKLAEMGIDSEFSAVHPDLRPGPHLLLTVSDTGTGMGPQILERIFDPFFTTKAPGEGTGMGLSVVHGIVKDIGGTITVYSEPGKGTTFRVYLPVHEEEKEKAAPGESPVSTGYESILVVDDEPSVLAFERKTLERLGYKVTAKTSGPDALELFRRRPEGFNLVITDMTMPKMTGERLAEEIMQIRNDIPVILCTGFSRGMDENTARAKGVQAFIMKPIITADLAGTVRKVLDEGKEEVGSGQWAVGKRQSGISS